MFARVLVLDDGSTITAFLGIDLIGFGWEFSDELVDLIKAGAGVDRVFLQLSHTHSAPFPPSWMTSIYEQDADFLSEWRDKLREALPAVVRKAVGRLQPAELRVGRAAVQVGFNRRVMTDDGVVMAPNADAPVVPWVDTLSVHGAGGGPIAVVYCHAAHPVIVHGASTLMSADYPGYACARIRERLGDGVVPVFVQGCGADINGDSVAAGFEKARLAGDRLGNAVVQAVEAATPLEDDKLSFVARRIELPCTELPAAAEVEERIAVTRLEAGEDPEIYTVDRIKALEDLLRMIEEGERPTMRFDLAMVGAGEQWLFISLSGEVFSEYQRWIDATAPFGSTMVGAYANNFGGYIPTDADLELGVLGGYEAACWPAESCALIVPTRIALRPGIEGWIKTILESMWMELA